MEEKQFDCPGCGAQFEYAPGSEALVCPYCERVTRVPTSEEDIRELDFREHLDRAGEEQQTSEGLSVKCGACGAESSFEPNVTADCCPFCGTHIVATARSSRLIKPKSLLPFKVTREEAARAFKSWLKGLWFAPNALKREVKRTDAITGVYIPYWTYDCKALSYYRGQRGKDYFVNRPVRVRRGGRMVTVQKRVRRTRWYPAEGWVSNSFDDVLLLASTSLPDEKTRQLEPWDLDGLVPYADEYLSGFRTESYQIDAAQGFEQAKAVMDVTIRDSARRDIGGDHQRIQSIKTQYDRITFKHLLLPIWISAYRFRDEVYRFLVNGRTGEVQSERPWSWLKILAAALAGAALVGGLVWALG
jgi:DNA-directed RNA polymerase subunit RPC12/RpoP